MSHCNCIDLINGEIDSAKKNIIKEITNINNNIDRELLKGFEFINETTLEKINFFKTKLSLNKISDEFIIEFPKVDLHSHLDGSLRPQTIIDIATEEGILDTLPQTNAIDLQKWFITNANGSLETFLSTFNISVSVMQTKSSLERVAFENIVDNSICNVVYVETRFQPTLHMKKGLSLDEIVESIINGVNNGVKYVLSTGKFIKANIILCASRNQSFEEALQIAQLVIKYRGKGVVGFDIAGGEVGFRPSLFIDACNYIKNNNGLITIHAGETGDSSYIQEALQICGADRIGHGIRIMDDITIDSNNKITLGPLATYVRDRQIPLEFSISSNIQTKCYSKIEDHPIGFLYNLGFCITVNTDDKLMIGTNMNNEMLILKNIFYLDIKDFQKISLNSINSGFMSLDEKNFIINNHINPYFKKFLYNF